MTIGILLGCALGAALCLLTFALVAPRPRLGVAAARWQRQRARSLGLVGDDPGTQDRRSLSPRLGARVSARAVTYLRQQGFEFRRIRADLDLIGVPLEAHVARKCGYGLTGLILVPVTAATITALGVHPPWAGSAALSLALGALLFWIPDLAVAQKADARRSELRRALSCYLDLVAMSLSGGRGVPEALPAAARIGNGWAFELLRDTLDQARYVGSTPWAAFADLGRRVRVRELQDLGGALMLVADDGAKVRASLTARASTQRRRHLAEAEGAAAKGDQSIQMAQVVLALGFFLFLGYPAVVAVMRV